jgi:hypothetical protein
MNSIIVCICFLVSPLCKLLSPSLPAYKPFAQSLQSSIGAQPDVESSPTMTFGTAQRLPRPGKSGVPGPGGIWGQMAGLEHLAGIMMSQRLKHTKKSQSMLSASLRVLTYYTAW